MSTKPKPYLLLDVGGVLSPYGLTPPSDFSEREIGGFWVVWTDRHVNRIERLTKQFELIWATTWEQYANQALCPALQIDPLPFIKFVRGQTQTRKLDSVKEFVGDRPAAWIDDDLYDDARSWAAERNRNVPTLLVQTTPSIGFTDEHVDELLDFARRCEGEAS